MLLRDYIVMGYVYFACHDDDNGYRYAYTQSVRMEDVNILNYDFGFSCKVAVACKSKKRADEIIESWNKIFISDGTFAY